METMAYRASIVLTALLFAGHKTEAHYVPVTITTSSKIEDQLLVEYGNCEDMQGNLSLNFRNLGLQRIESDFASSLNVNCLNLENNEIDYVSPDAFRLLPNLLYLNLARNELSLSNFTHLSGHVHLRTLILDENKNALLSEGVIFQLQNVFPRLLNLYLRNNAIRDILSLAFAPKLTNLYLSSNNLSDSTLSFLSGGPATLISLDLADNGISYFNASGLASLRELRLDDNRLERLCGKSYCRVLALVLEGTVALRRLSLSRNRLVSIEPDAFDDARNLVHLDLSHNKIDSIRKNTFENAEMLRNLSLEDNLLSEMPDLYGPESLEYLSLANNKLKSITNDSFSLIDKLKFLNLSNNVIGVVEAGAFARQLLLEVLDLSNNRLVNFPYMWLTPMMNLKSLSVNGNWLRSINDLQLGTVKTHAKLQYVNLKNNLITKFYTSSLYNSFRNIANVTLEFLDSDNRALRRTILNNEMCSCDCNADNSVFI